MSDNSELLNKRMQIETELRKLPAEEMDKIIRDAQKSCLEISNPLERVKCEIPRLEEGVKKSKGNRTI